MSNQYPGGFITKDYVAPTPTSASGIWTLDQQEQAKQAGIWPVGGPFNYVENVFSTNLFTGTSAAQTITNNIDLSTYGGLVWIKDRTTASTWHQLFDTARGGQYSLASNVTSGQYNLGGYPTRGVQFNTNGYSINDTYNVDISGAPNVSWTFRKQAKFFDVVSYTGNGTEGYAINHNLGSVPGCIIVKDLTSGSNDWCVYHQSLGNTKGLYLNATNAAITFDFWANTTPTSTQFYVANMSKVNTSGNQYIAYLFAHNAGGFGLTGTDNVITCGTFTTSGSGTASVTLGYEPQWVTLKCASSAENWVTIDSMRGFNLTASNALEPNTTNVEYSLGAITPPNATGFSVSSFTASATYIYIAIRRGPMAVPTDATKVFKTLLWTGNDAASRNISGVGFVPDVANLIRRNNAGGNTSSGFYDRLRGNPLLATTSVQSESYWAGTSINMGAFGQADLTLPSNASQWNQSPYLFAGEFFARAPGFFDEVCYTGIGSSQTLNHNLTVVPELIIIKKRSAASTTGWPVQAYNISGLYSMAINTTSVPSSGTNMWTIAPTTTTFQVNTNTDVSASGATFVAYLFASCPGVSKVGSYTGTGATQTINCGFTGGARFVMIKRLDTSGAWYIWDSTRGMVTGTDPYTLWNSSAAEVNADNAFTITGGFQLVSSLAGINASGGSYLYLAIA